MCMFCRSLFVLLLFVFWPLCCLSFFDLQLLIISLWYHQTFLTNLKQIMFLPTMLNCDLMSSSIISIVSLKAEKDKNKSNHLLFFPTKIIRTSCLLKDNVTIMKQYCTACNTRECCTLPFGYR